jgi:hypothetical protein
MAGGHGYRLEAPGRSLELTSGRTVTVGDLAGAVDGIVAEVVRNPQAPEVLGLKNLSASPWQATVDGVDRDVAPGQTVRLKDGVRLSFGASEGTVGPLQSRFRLRLPRLAALRQLSTSRKLLGFAGAVVVLGTVALAVIWFKVWNPHGAGLKQNQVVELPAAWQQLRLDGPPPALPRSRATAPPVTATKTLDLPALASSSGQVTPTEGGTVTLASGAKVQIPAGAVSKPVTVKLSELQMSGLDKATSRLYRLEPDGLSFARSAPATLVFPIDAARAAKDKGQLPVTVSRRVPGKGWEHLPVKVDLAQGTVSAQTEHFSDYDVSHNTWGDEFSLERPPVKLQVPYYSQHLSNWCGPASCQMLLKYYGRYATTWDIRAAFVSMGVVDPDDGVASFWLAPFFNGRGVKIDQKLTG